MPDPVAVPHGAQDARWHVPQVARRSDGRWGVFCAACSHSHGDYVNPCHAFTQDEWPPPILEATDATRL